MAVPKKKMSRSRTRRPTANRNVSAPRVSPCPQCNAAKLPPRVCPESGTDRGREDVSQGRDQAHDGAHRAGRHGG